MEWITTMRDEMRQAAARRRELAARQAAARVAETGASAGSWSGRRNEAKRDVQRQRDIADLQAEGWEPGEVQRWGVNGTGMEIDGHELAGLLDGYRNDGAEVERDSEGGWTVRMPGGEVREYPAAERQRQDEIECLIEAGFLTESERDLEAG